MNFPRLFDLKLSVVCLALAGYATPANAQFKLQQSFANTVASGWTLTNSAFLTAPTIDATGSGWLRLTDAIVNEQGQALNTGFSFAGNQPVTIEFSYVAWGGTSTGADGIAVFLYDSSTPSPMAGAVLGGGLGYCGGAGGYLAIGLDEYGNFSNPFDACTNGGPGKTPESMVIRGPQSANNPWVTTTSVPGGIDNPGVTARPSPNTVILTLTPAVTPTVGFTLSAQFRSASGQPFHTLFSNVPFNYIPPTNLSVGFSGGTGSKTNVHELQGLVAGTADDIQVTMTGPTSVLQGSAVTYTVTVLNDGNDLLSAGNSPTVLDNLPASVTGATWTCVGSGGATCAASGAGNIDTTGLSLPANGSARYTITGALDPATTCGATVVNAASAEFSGSTSFLDPDETNNTASINSTVTCDTTLVANPAALIYTPQQVNVASTAQIVTLTEGVNSATITSIAVTGDYAQTNDCPAALSAAQTCTVNVVFSPTALGSRNGTLTILSNNPAGSPSAVTSVVSLSGTGVNEIPSPFSFTPLSNVEPSSLQVSNAINVASTDAPAPISVSTGGQYSINGGAFTAVPGVVAPGAQVQVRLSAASGYSTTDSAALTIGGVSSTFTVTTGAQPMLRGAFTPVTGAVPSSEQISNAITVTGTSILAPISISSGDEYSIDGGPYTAAAGTVQPGDQVTVQMTAPSSYGTTASAVLTIGGVMSTFTVTTASQPAQQGGFTPVTGSSISTNQISNPITITSILVPTPISIDGGGEYSINGGPFTTLAGSVAPGAQVRVEITSPATYNSTATAVLSVGDTPSNFSVTNGAQPMLQGSFTPVTDAGVSSVNVSNAITVTGIATSAVISIGSGAQYSINGGPFTTAAGTVMSGDSVRVELTSSSTYSVTAVGVLTIDGVIARYTVTTGIQPLQGVVVTGGGGVINGTMLLMLALLVALKIVVSRRAAFGLIMTLGGFAALSSSPARADEVSWLSNTYGGIRLGDSTSSLTAAKLTHALQAEGYDVTAASAECGTASGTLYAGYELRERFAVELAATYVGRTRVALVGVLPADLNRLLADAAYIERGNGDIVSVVARYRWPLIHGIDLDLRAGPYGWITRTVVYVAGVDELKTTEGGLGFTLGVGSRFALGRHLGLGVGADYFRSTAESHYVQFAATLEYHLRYTAIHCLIRGAISVARHQLYP